MEKLPDPRGWEVIHGRLHERRVAARSSWISGKITSELIAYEMKYGGWAFGGGLELVIDPLEPSTLLYRCSGAYIEPGRLAELSDTYLDIPPDLTVEVVSPTTTFVYVEGKVRDCLRLGVRMVWVVLPRARAIYVHRKDGPVSRLDEGDLLFGENVLPGFEVAVSEIFRRPAAAASLPIGRVSEAQS
jgi:Uma2 family endonuclease